MYKKLNIHLTWFQNKMSNFETARKKLSLLEKLPNLRSKQIQPKILESLNLRF